MTSPEKSASHMESLQPSPNGRPGQQGSDRPAARTKRRRYGWTGWLELWVSAATAFIIAGGSAFLAAEMISSRTLIVALVAAAMATANDIRQQMKKPPVGLPKV